jgi:multidrug efflux pump
MLSSKLLKHREQMPWFYRVTEPFFVRMTNGYRNSLEAFMRHRWLAFPSLAACGLLCMVIFNALPSELAPLEDRAQLSLNATAPEGASYEYMTAVLATIQEDVPEREAIVAVTSPGFGSSSTNSGFFRLMLKPAPERERTQQEIANHLTQEVKALSGARVSVSQDETISVGRRGGLPVQFVLQAPNLKKLEEAIPSFLEAAQSDPTFAFVDVNLKFTKPELTVQINRERAQTLGISVLDVSETLQLALSEARLGYFIRNGQQYQVLGQAERDYRSETLDLKSLYVRTSGGDPVSLDNLVTVSEESRPIARLYDRRRHRSHAASCFRDTRRFVPDLPCGYLARLRRELEQPAVHLPAGTRADLPHPGRAV